MATTSCRSAASSNPATARNTAWRDWTTTSRTSPWSSGGWSSGGLVRRRGRARLHHAGQAAGELLRTRLHGGARGGGGRRRGRRRCEGGHPALGLPALLQRGGGHQG